ncbi:hypothetical protein RJ641_003054 [Dillenia turbinata]|uniref:Arabinanase/levansucrase/invertase n=1 Tax=Dillenia turbinata TaxID=194707 RepID=A0AAN8ZAR4_9MAGN
MEAAARIHTVDLPASSTVQRVSNTAYCNRGPGKAEMLTLKACSRTFRTSFARQYKGTYPNPSNKILILTHCSTKPEIGNDSATSKNPGIKLDPDSRKQSPAVAPPNQAPSSTCSKGLVFNLGSGKSWDVAEIGSPVVKRYMGDDEERWYMWYHGSCNCSSDSVGLAVSSNGIHWERGAGPVRSCGDAGVVMSCSKNWWAFDTESIRPSELVIMSSPMYSAVYWLYYTGYTSEEVEFSYALDLTVENPERVFCSDQDDRNYGHSKILKSLPGLACSQDGRHWARIEGDHHSGALLDVGSGNDWDSLFIAGPHVVVHSSDDLRMYYHSFDRETGHFSIGLARSRDGIRWVKLGKIMGGGSHGSFDELGIRNACVVRNGKDGHYMMAYEGLDIHGTRSIGLAFSPDGLKNWRRLQEAVLKQSEEDGWDNKGVGSPCLVQMDGDAEKWRLYYQGSGQGGKLGIGMAIAEETNIRKFRRWSNIHM